MGGTGDPEDLKELCSESKDAAKKCHTALKEFDKKNPGFLPEEALTGLQSLAEGKRPGQGGSRGPPGGGFPGGGATGGQFPGGGATGGNFPGGPGLPPGGFGPGAQPGNFPQPPGGFPGGPAVGPGFQPPPVGPGFVQPGAAPPVQPALPA